MYLRIQKEENQELEKVLNIYLYKTLLQLNKGE